jgi:hypothetical protein
MAQAQSRLASAASIWAFGPEHQEIIVRNAEAVLAYLPLFLVGWPMRRIGADGMADSPEPDVDIIEQDDRRLSVALTGPGSNCTLHEDAFNAANGLAGALVAAYVTRQAEVACLHAASVKIGGGIAVLLGDSLAGKTSTALQIAAAGHCLFGDDRIAVHLRGDAAPQGEGLGLMPKVRLPLPEDCGQRFADYVEAFTEIQGEDAAYLKLWEGEAAAFGEKAPLATLVILDRVADASAATINPASQAEILKSLLANCFAPHIDNGLLVPALERLSTAIPGLVLRFSSSREAASLLSAQLKSAAA